MSLFYIGVALVTAGFAVAALLDRAMTKVIGAMLVAVGVYALVTTHPAIAERARRDEARVQFCEGVADSVERWNSRRSQSPESQQVNEWVAIKGMLIPVETLCLDKPDSCAGIAYAPGYGPFDQELPRRLEALVRGDGCK